MGSLDAHPKEGVDGESWRVWALSALIPSAKGPMGRALGSLLPRELPVCVGGRRCLDQQQAHPGTS